jgi:hypothetical protein
MLSLLNVANIVVEEKYLGLPTPNGRMGKGKFKTTKERLVKRFSNWVERHMSACVKVVLIDQVSCPSYFGICYGNFQTTSGNVRGDDPTY